MNEQRVVIISRITAKYKLIFLYLFVLACSLSTWVGRKELFKFALVVEVESLEVLNLVLMCFLLSLSILFVFLDNIFNLLVQPLYFVF